MRCQSTFWLGGSSLLDRDQSRFLSAVNCSWFVYWAVINNGEDVSHRSEASVVPQISALSCLPLSFAAHVLCWNNTDANSWIRKAGRANVGNLHHWFCVFLVSRWCWKLLLWTRTPHEATSDPHDSQPPPELWPLQKNGDLCMFSCALLLWGACLHVTWSSADFRH